MQTIEKSVVVNVLKEGKGERTKKMERKRDRGMQGKGERERRNRRRKGEAARRVKLKEV